jgi:hypothetical protein
LLKEESMISIFSRNFEGVCFKQSFLHSYNWILPLNL